MKTFVVLHISVNPKDRFTLEIDENLSSDAIVTLLDDEVLKRGHSLSGGKKNVFVKLITGECISLENTNLKSDDVEYIIHSYLPSMDNAFGFARIDGIAFDFRSKEKGHIEYPHVHAYAEDEVISISLRDYKVIGHFKSKVKMKRAINYVKENQGYFLEGWRRLTEEDRVSSLEQLKQEMNYANERTNWQKSYSD